MADVPGEKRGTWSGGFTIGTSRGKILLSSHFRLFPVIQAIPVRLRSNILPKSVPFLLSNPSADGTPAQPVSDAGVAIYPDASHQHPSIANIRFPTTAGVKTCNHSDRPTGRMRLPPVTNGKQGTPDSARSKCQQTAIQFRLTLCTLRRRLQV